MYKIFQINSYSKKKNLKRENYYVTQWQYTFPYNIKMCNEQMHASFFVQIQISPWTLSSELNKSKKEQTKFSGS